MRAVIYARVSTADQVDNYSLDTQIKACIEYCEQHELEVERVFREEGASAKTAARPELKKLMDYCAAHPKGIDHLVVYRVDRLARRVIDHQMIRMTLRKFGVSVRAVQESFDDSASGKLIENLMASMAQFDNDLRSARAIDGMREGLSRGRWMWRAPIGYLRVPKGSHGPSLIPDPETAHLVRRAFEMYATGTMEKREVLEVVTDLGLLRN